jgi:hypothetical protein
MKTYLVLATLCFSSFAIVAQERIPVKLKDFQVNLNILDPSISVEKKINPNQSFTLGFGLTGLPDDDGTSLNPYLRGSYRNYYPRKKVKKALRPNSGNYIGLIAGYNFDAIADNIDFGTTRLSNSFFMGPVWGIQRNYQSGIHLGLSLGGGFGIGQHSDFFFTGVGSFQLGFVIK